MGGERETRDGEVTRKSRAVLCPCAPCTLLGVAGRVRRPGGRAGPGARDSGNPDRSRASLLTLKLNTHVTPRRPAPPPRGRGRAVGIKISFLCLGWAPWSVVPAPQRHAPSADYRRFGVPACWSPSPSRLGSSRSNSKSHYFSLSSDLQNQVVVWWRDSAVNPEGIPPPTPYGSITEFKISDI
jgi:hypothetical protein